MTATAKACSTRIPAAPAGEPGGGCAADYDVSGCVGTEGYDLFVYDYEQGYPWADVDASGFVDTDDVDAFVAAYEEGC